jgi:MFS family permease
MTTKCSRSWPFQGWINVVVAALVMLATLPGRTHGLGLITEPLLKELNLDRLVYADINLWATLIGALFCLPIGYLTDRIGVRGVTVMVTVGLALVVWQVSLATGGVVWFFVLITLTRGLGQSALSVTSITMVGKWFKHRLGMAMGVYSVLVTLFFASTFGLVGGAVIREGWRVAWYEIALVLLLGVAPIVWIFVRNTPESCGLPPDVAPSGDSRAKTPARSFTLSEAMRTPAFWIFGGATSLYGLVSSGLGLFNQAVLAERGFDRTVYYHFLAVTTLIGLGGQLISGWVMMRWSICRLMAVAMFLYAAGLGLLPFVHSSFQLWTFAAAVGLAGGIITVTFFAVWSRAYGQANLGRIQSVAQIQTVLASAVGPVLFAKCAALTHSYSPILFTLAPIVLLLGVAAWRVSLPAGEATEEAVSGLQKPEVSAS